MSFRTKKYLAIGGAILALFFLALNFLWQDKTSGAEFAMPRADVRDLAGERYQEVRKELLAIVQKENPRVALLRLQEYGDTDAAVLRRCHDLTHEVGRAAYRKYGDFAEAAQYDDTLCNSGYLHGVMEAYLSGRADVQESLKGLCASYTGKSFKGWECFHGIGHAVMYYTSNDLPRSLELCQQFSDEAGAGACLNGVFMENSAADGVEHTSVWIKKDDPFYPCNQLSGGNQGQCYIYVPVVYLQFHKNDYIGAAKVCGSLSGILLDYCSFGVGSQVMKENLSNVKFAEWVCGAVPQGTTGWCIEGMIVKIINNYASVEKGKEACGRLEDRNKAGCERTVAAKVLEFEK